VRISVRSASDSIFGRRVSFASGFRTRSHTDCPDRSLEVPKDSKNAAGRSGRPRILAASSSCCGRATSR